MTSRRLASVGIIGPAVAALALLTMGSQPQPQPQFGDPLQGLSPDLLARFQAGKAVFERDFDPRDGLGPVFNNTSCAKCHDQGAIGGGSDTLETRYGQVIDGVFNSLTQFDGQLLHSKGIGLFNGVDFVGEVVPPEANVVAQRRTNPLFGLGLVDAVPDQIFLDLAQFQQEFTPETAGRALVLTDIFSGQPRVGRFGWKSQIGTVLTFSGNAFLNEMGITTPFFPHENPPGGRRRTAGRESGADQSQQHDRDGDAAQRPHDVPGAPRRNSPARVGLGKGRVYLLRWAAPIATSP